MYFQNYGLQKTWLDKGVKSPGSEHTSTANMLKSTKHALNLHGSSFIIFVHHCEEREVVN